PRRRPLQGRPRAHGRGEKDPELKAEERNGTPHASLNAVRVGGFRGDSRNPPAGRDANPPLVPLRPLGPTQTTPTTHCPFLAPSSHDAQPVALPNSNDTQPFPAYSPHTLTPLSLRFRSPN